MHRAGVVLAAGFGSRLGQLKPLTPVGGVPLLQRALRSLEVAGCTRIAVVGGHGARELEAWLDKAYTLLLNPRYELQNGLSVLAAREWLQGSKFILTMADHVVDDALMRLAGDHELPEGSATLLVDSKIDTILDLDDATKVVSSAGRLQRIGKQLTEYDAIDCGVFVATTGLLEALQEVVDRRGDASLSEGVQLLADRGRMHVLDVGDCFWQDVDTPAMLAHAERRLN